MCQIYKQSVEFLGQQICGGGMTPTEAKLKAVRDWAKPQNVRDIQSFLGFANYYRMVHQELCRCGGPIDGFDQEECAVAMGIHISNKPFSS